MSPFEMFTYDTLGRERATEIRRQAKQAHLLREAKSPPRPASLNLAWLAGGLFLVTAFVWLMQ